MVERTTIIFEIVVKFMNTWTETNYGKNTMKQFIKMKNLWEYLQYVKKNKMMQIRQGLQKHLGRRKKTMSSKN